MDLKNIDLFLFDLDGTLYLGDEPLAGAPETVAALRGAGKRICFLTNNSSRARAGYLAKLERMGFAPRDGEFCSSALVTADWLKRAGKTRNVYFLAPAAVRRDFTEAGIGVIDYADNNSVAAVASVAAPRGSCGPAAPPRRGRPQEAAGTAERTNGGTDCREYTVVVGFDTELAYDNLRTACALIRGGAFFAATHPDKTCPTPRGFIPDAGSFLALIAAAAGRKPDVICGKPHKPISDYIMRKYKIKDRRRVCMVGDRLTTDIKFGLRNKFASVLVMTGETTEVMLRESAVKPDLVLDDARGILGLI
ncbi:MAG: HAD-IIA family hydrolase [Clostridiales bacterium]|jgi:HAD superfamily hydrolase (TIGR01450 family)|nr:HAD-IIA family hydrolase [Clostridiales bacterium]